MARIHLLLLASFLCACGGDDDGADDPAALDDFAEQLVAARCAAELDCHAYADEAACRAATRVSLADVKALVAAGTVAFHAEHADGCLATVGRLFSCSAGDRLIVAQEGIGDCGELFTGTRADGEVCHTGEECRSQRCEKPSSCQNAQCCAGTCRAAEARAGLGESCASSTCVGEAYCQRDVDGNRTVCAARIADGQSCVDFDSCQAPSVCVEGSCRRLPGDGEACSVTVPCDRFDQACGAEGTCEPLARLGEACVVSESGHNCVENAYCAADLCVANPGAGQACETAGPECQGDLDCDNGMCTLAPDEACQVSST